MKKKNFIKKNKKKKNKFNNNKKKKTIKKMITKQNKTKKAASVGARCCCCLRRLDAGAAHPDASDSADSPTGTGRQNAKHRRSPHAARSVGSAFSIARLRAQSINTPSRPASILRVKARPRFTVTHPRCPAPWRYSFSGVPFFVAATPYIPLEGANDA